MKLYIIGNGFDIHHGFNTRFLDFKKFMDQKYKDVVRRWLDIVGETADFEIEDAWLGVKKDWSNIEKSFEHVDYDELINACSTYLVDYGAGDWKDAYHYDYQYEIEQYLNLALYSDKYLREWLETVNCASDKKLLLETESLYLNFNYTDTLENVYSIPPENICHIHGYINEEEKLILGHNNPDIIEEVIGKLNRDDIRIIEADRIIDFSKSNSYKNSDFIINENSDFFEKIHTIEEIYIIGHSSKAMEEVDNQYYQKIYSLIEVEKVKINVIYYDEKDIKIYKENLEKLGFQNIEFNTYDSISLI